MHHDMPMKLQNSIQSGNTFHPITIQNSRLGNEHWTPIFGMPMIQLGILSLKYTWLAPKCQYRVRIKIMLPGIRADFGGLLDHCDDVIVFEFTGTEPASEAIGFSLNGAEGVDGGFEFSSAVFDFLTEFHLGSGGEVNVG